MEHIPVPEKIEKGLQELNMLLEDNGNKNNCYLQDEDIDFLKELLTYREAIMREEGTSFDVNTLYADFIKQRQRKETIRKRILYTIGAVAASILVIISVNVVLNDRNINENPIPVEYVARDEAQEITLQIDDQPAVVIPSQSTDYKRHETKENNKTPLVASAVANKLPHTYTISIPRGKTYHLVLDDNTEVWLNADSKLLYPNHFIGNERVVELQGEAYFKVAKDASRRFIVKSKDLTTTVLGTEFNFRAYPYNTSVTLVEGAVNVQTAENDNATLKPGQNVTVQNKELKVNEVDVKKYTSWIDGYFYFDGERLDEIMKELGRWYNINIIFEDQQTAMYEFKFWAKKSDSLEKTVINLNQMGKVSVEINENSIIIKDKK